MKTITILGATGSIGTQCLYVISQNPNLYNVDFLTTLSNITLLEQQCNKFKPNGVVIVNEIAYKEFISKTTYKGKILCGKNGLIEAVSSNESSIIVSALVGIAGLKPIIEAINNKKTILLANKETLVVAGEYIMDLAKQNEVQIIPIDSEHSAIFQCLQGEKIENVNKIILTASGGPFFNVPINKLRNVKAADAMKHPTWNMGKKVSIDSSTMINKGFEVIEAKYLFEIDVSKIDILIHPQSIIHSMIEFVDNSIKAQLATSDMRIPIAYALSYSNRISNNCEKLDFKKYNKLEFYEVPINKFECLNIAYQCINKGGNTCAILNAANEIAVEKFINNKIHFLNIPKIINEALNNINFISNPSINDLFDTDKITRTFIINYLSNAL
jgi:1-deoxy-D-xylulose-5-phosphate reductoisomerase